MAGYRGIFLDELHPLIAERLDADTLGFQRSVSGVAESDDNQYRNKYVDGLATYKYLQERTPWMRTVPFAIPQDPTSLASYSGIEGIKFENYPLVPDWREWILWGVQAGKPHIMETTDGESQAYYDASTAHNRAGRGPNGLYRASAKSSLGGNQAGIKNTPVPGLVSLQVSNKGDLGTIRRASFDIKCFSLDDLEQIEMMYMVPGLNVLVEWGWYHPRLTVDPLDINSPLTTSKHINQEILKRVFGVDNLLHHEHTPGANSSNIGPDAGIYDGLLGTVTKFNWTNAADGSYDVRIDLISPGSLASGVPVDSYVLGATQQIEKKATPVSDLRSIGAIVRHTTGDQETERQEQKEGAELKKLERSVKIISATGTDCTYENVVGDKTYNLAATHKLDIDAGVGITAGEDGKLVFAEANIDSTPKDEYFIGEYKGGGQMITKIVKGDPEWFARALGPYTTYKKKDLSNGKWKNHAESDLSSIGKWFDLDDETAEHNDAVTLVNYLGPILSRGDYFCTQKWRTDSSKGWGLWVRDNGSWVESKWLDEDFFWNGTASDFFYGSAPKPSMWVTTTNDPAKIRSEGYEAAKWIENVPGLESMQSGKKTRTVGGETWTKDDSGKWYDSKGNQQFANLDGGFPDKWGTTSVNDHIDKKYADSFVVEKQTGISIYKKNKDTGKVTLVTSMEGDPDTLRADIASGANTSVVSATGDRKAEFQKKKQERLSKINDITAKITNKHALSWGGGIKFDTKKMDGSMVYADLESQFTPEKEYGYQTITAGTGEEFFPVGMVAYSETYVSWRFIEDYVINELYMPRTSIPSTDPSESVDYTKNITDLETACQSTTVMTSKEMKALGMSESDYTRDDGTYIEVHAPQMICSSKYLRSMDPFTCILPGQESVPPIKAVTGLNIEDVKSTFKDTVIDHVAEKYMDQNMTSKSGINLYTGYDASDGTTDFGAGILRNIMVNIDLVEEVADKATNVRKFLTTLTSAINKACGMPWDFKIINLSANNQLKVIDANYTPHAKDYKPKSTQMQDGVYMFSGTGADNICKDVKIQSKIPQELATMAYYSSMTGPKEKGSEIQMFNMYRAGVQDRLKVASNVSVVGAGDDSEAAEDVRAAAEALLLNSYRQMVAQSRWAATFDKPKDPSFKEGPKIAKNFVSKYIHGNTKETPAYRPPMPIDVSIELNGVSGIYMGNAIMIKTIAEGGILPSRYRGGVALQATAVDHTVTPQGWSTSVSTLMRPLPDVQNIPKFQVNTPAVDTRIQGNVKAYNGVTPEDLPIGNPYGSGNKHRVSSQFGNKEAFRKGSHGGLDIATPVGTPFYCCLDNATVSFHKQTGDSDGTANGVSIANTNGYGYYVRIKGYGFGAKSDTQYQIDYGHCEGFVDPTSTWFGIDLNPFTSDTAKKGSILDFEAMEAHGKTKMIPWKTGTNAIYVPGKIKYGAPVGTCGGTRRMKGAGNSGGPHLHMTIKGKDEAGSYKEKLDPQLMVQDYYVVAGGGANDHLNS